jgi:pantoate--beta-alanine ligase
VATIVAKLFHIVAPHRAYFGQKDAAQVAVLRAMVRDLNFPVELVACPIVREPDGLALSSRNRYLSADERSQALALSRALRQVESLAASGERLATVLIDAARQILAGQAPLRIDYIELVDASTLQPLDNALPGSLFAVAAWVGATRLIDNTLLA